MPEISECRHFVFAFCSIRYLPEKQVTRREKDNKETYGFLRKLMVTLERLEDTGLGEQRMTGQVRAFHSEVKTMEE